MPRKLSDLPFVSTSDEETKYWVTSPTGDFDTDFVTGKTYGDTLVRYSRNTNDPIILQCVVKDMSRDRIGDLEKGFFQAVMGATFFTQAA